MSDLLDIVCPTCSAAFKVEEAAEITSEIAEVAALARALGIVREVTCPTCHSTVRMRPGPDGEGVYVEYKVEAIRGEPGTTTLWLNPADLIRLRDEQ